MLTSAISADTSRFDRMATAIGQTMTAPLAGGPLRAGAEEAMQVYADATQRRFNLASGGDGTWPALARSTVLKKRRHTLFPERILYLSGKLFASLTPGGTNSIYEVMTDRVRYGTRDPVAHFHQVGGGRLPARPILVAPTREVLERCTAEVSAGLQKAILNACANN
ncbi:MAG TPA: phage virion morphogenesis protein [Tepidisphaeraceae bacterium]